MIVTGREELIAALRSRHLRIDTRKEMLEAADMLEADALELTRLRDLARDAATAATQLQKQVLVLKAHQLAVPAGYVLVPIEPTPEMLSAFHAAVNVWMKEIGENADIYKAMLTATQGAKP